MNSSYKSSLHGMDMDEAKKTQLTSLLAQEIEAKSASEQIMTSVPCKRKNPKRAAKAALAFAACLALCGGAAYGIASNSGFFDDVFGNSTKADLPVERVENASGGEELYWPETDYVAVDQETASRLLDDAVCSQPVTLTYPDRHVLTVEKSVRSEDFLVYSFTLHRDGGVTGLTYSKSNNRDKGASFTDAKHSIYWELGTFADDDLFSGNSNLFSNYIYVDLEKSTKDTVVGYGYGCFEEPVAAGEPITLHAFTQDEGKDNKITHEYSEVAVLQCTDVVESRTLTSGGGQMKVSPLGVTASYDDGKGRSFNVDQALSLKVAYKDGSEYLVFQDELTLNSDGSRKWDEQVKNYFVGVFTDQEGRFAFNRLVDPDAVDNVNVQLVGPDGQSPIVVTFK